MKTTFKEESKTILKEIELAIDTINSEDVTKLIEYIGKADKVFFVGVGRVLLSLEATAKRLAHLGVNVFIVGQITEPAISENDLLIVGSGSGETFFPLGVARKAKSFNATVVHIGVNPNSSMNEFSDLFFQIKSNSRYELEGEIKSVQPMTSLFEQSLFVLGDVIALMMIKENSIDIKKLWQYHANLE